MKSWIGKHSEPCVSDVHDAVVVMGHYRFPSHAAAPQLLVAEAPLDFAQPVCAAVEEVSASKDAQPAPPPPLTPPPCDSEVLVAGEVSANTSGDVHPPGLPLTTLKKRIPLGDIEETLGAIFETAGCENDAIRQLAAEDLLKTLVLNNDGLSLKRIEDVMTAMREPILRRTQYVSYVATTYGVEESSTSTHRAASKSYTREEWSAWYETNPLSEREMAEAIDQWKDEFPCEQRTKIASLRKQNTKASKAQATKLLNGAFKVYLKNVCGIRQVAIEFLRNPSKDVHGILSKWAQYMQSQAYRTERERSRRIIDKNSSQAQLRQAQQELKLKVHSLRAKYGNMSTLDKKMSDELWQKLPRDVRQSYKEWRSGAMEQELDELTKRHGYGKLRSENILLGPTRGQ